MARRRKEDASRAGPGLYATVDAPRAQSILDALREAYPAVNIDYILRMLRYLAGETPASLPRSLRAWCDLLEVLDRFETAEGLREERNLPQEVREARLDLRRALDTIGRGLGLPAPFFGMPLRRAHAGRPSPSGLVDVYAEALAAHLEDATGSPRWRIVSALLETVSHLPGRESRTLYTPHAIEQRLSKDRGSQALSKDGREIRRAPSLELLAHVLRDELHGRPTRELSRTELRAHVHARDLKVEKKPHKGDRAR